jgi:general nucleoside transport system permease protein
LHRWFGIQAVGENPVAARYAGFRVTRVILLTAAVSGALADLGAVGEVAGPHFQAALLTPFRKEKR